MELIVGICLQMFFFRNVMCIGDILEPGRITRGLYITDLSQLIPNNVK